MTEMELVRNDDLTFSALKLLVELPWVELAGKFRLYDKKISILVFVFSIIMVFTV